MYYSKNNMLDPLVPRDKRLTLKVGRTILHNLWSMIAILNNRR